MDVTENSADAKDNSNDGTENSTDTINNSTDGTGETADTEQADTATNVSESVNSGTNEPQASGGGPIDIPFSLWVLFLIFGIRIAGTDTPKTLLTLKVDPKEL